MYDAWCIHISRLCFRLKLTVLTADGSTNYPTRCCTLPVTLVTNPCSQFAVRRVQIKFHFRVVFVL